MTRYKLTGRYEQVPGTKKPKATAKRHIEQLLRFRTLSWVGLPTVSNMIENDVTADHNLDNPFINFVFVETEGNFVKSMIHFTATIETRLEIWSTGLEIALIKKNGHLRDLQIEVVP